jgi:hypothetical protein
MIESIAAFDAWRDFRSLNVRFLGYGDPHVPEQEERTFHAFTEGFKAGAAFAQSEQKEAK